MILNLFSIPLWIHKIEIPETLVDQCYSLSKEPGRIASNNGGWQSDLLSPDTFPDLTKELILLINQTCFDISESFKGDLLKYWVNINRKGDFNIPHIHSNAALSGVIYLKCDEKSGNIKFESNSVMNHFPINTFDSKILTTTSEYHPMTGDVLIFPAWLRHSVLPNKSHADRISIAFNIIQK